MLLARLTLFSLLAILGCARGAAPGHDSGPGGADAGGVVPDASTCPASPCDIAEQCGCGGGQVCDVDFEVGDGSSVCRDVVVPGNEAANCEDATGCGGGYTCIEPGHCRKYCDDNLDCAAGAECFFQLVDGDAQPIEGARLCTKACEPDKTTANGCPAAPQFACRILLLDPDQAATGDEHFVSDCGGAPAVGGGDGAACDGGSSQCQAGYDCFSITSGPTTSLLCKQVCVWEVSGNAGPRTCTTGGRVCQQLVEPVALIANTEYGACL